ncbi:sensor histidine kinase [Microbacterium hibisci]|uniref:sensor histidine kinase n=1 Tax=Microbacterium hibisci TaxID=2036000 RepID=UPI001EF31FE0|nr:histidine kinase [Microbacterium hibisci]
MPFAAAAASAPAPARADAGAADPAGRTGWRAWTSPLDLAIAGGIGVWAMLEALLVPSAHPVAQVGFAVAISLPLAVRRRLPATVMLVVAAALVLHAALAGADATFNPFPSLLVATFTVAERVRPWPLAALLGLVPIAAMLGAHALGYFGAVGIETAGALFLVFFVGSTWTAGRIVRHRALSLQSTRDSSAQRAAEAAASERRRIARELHDIVAHSLSIVALQAAAAEQFVERDPARARTHLQLTRRTAQGALDEMRHLLEVLREDEASYVPQPGLSALPDLIAETEAAGHRCTLMTDAATDGLPDGLALAVYRIVQESLTNVRKHAPGAEVEVGVTAGAGELEVRVENGPPTRSLAASVAGGGNGLPGMSERARLYGGRLESGPTPAGGWRVRAIIPVEAA